MRSRMLRVVLPLLLVVSSLSLIVVTVSADQEPQYGGQLVYAYNVQPDRLFPGYGLGSPENEVRYFVYENLVDLNEHGEIVPWLAKSWEFSGDGLTCTMRLQEGVTFSNGNPFNASVVEFVLEEAISKEFSTYNLLSGIARIDASDEYTVVFHLNQPQAAFITNLAYGALCMWDPVTYQTEGLDWYDSNMMGTGPFTLEEWRHGEYLLFVKNPNYWQSGLPYLDSVKVLLVPEQSVRAMMLEAGAADRAIALNDRELSRLEANSNINVYTVPSTRQYYLILNNHKHPLDNPIVRRALNYAIDKIGAIDSVFAGVGAFPPKEPGISEGVVGFTDLTEPGEETVYAYDPQKAVALLKQAGYEDRNSDGTLEDPSGNPLVLSLWTPEGRYKNDLQLAELLQTMLQQIGVSVKLHVWEFSTYVTMIGEPTEDAQYEMVLASWGVPGDPDELMMLLYHSEAGPGLNRMFYANPDVDRLAVAARQEVDPQKREELIAEWGRLILYDAPVIFLPTVSKNLGSRTYVHGDRILPIEKYPCRFAWLDSEEMERQGIER